MSDDKPVVYNKDGSIRKKTGAPEMEMTDELADRIIHLVSTHPIGYDKLRLVYPDIPSHLTIQKWRHNNEAFASRYLQALAIRCQIQVEDIDDMFPDRISTYEDEKGRERIDAPSAALIIAKANNRKWMASRLVSKRFGEKREIDGLNEKNTQLELEIQKLRTELNTKNENDY